MKNVLMELLIKEIEKLKKELDSHESIMMQMQDALREKDSIKLKEAEHLLSQIGFEWNKRKGCFVRKYKRWC